MTNCLLSIGGSGHRSLKPLVFLAAAGALGEKDLALLCVDNDSTNGNLDETLNLIHLYNRVRGKDTWLADAPFFKPNLKLMDDKPWSPFTDDPTLDLYLKHPSMRASNENLTELYKFLYDREKRELKVSEGFRGKPSIGAAAYRAAARKNSNGANDSLGRLRVELENAAAQGRPVKLFSMGSIFGGTGAAGLPNIPASLIEGMKQGSDHVLSGAAFLLPYFEFNPSDLDKDGPHANPNDFIMMMKDALRYYRLNPSRYQCVYAIGADHWRHISTAAVGKKEQKNQADLTEFLAALAASNFLVAWQPDPNIGRINGASEPLHSQEPELYVLHRESDGAFKWSDVPERERIKPKLAAFTRFCFLYLSEFADRLQRPTKKDLESVWFHNHITAVGVNPNSAEFQERAKSMREFCAAFLRWWQDLHERSGIGLQLIHTNAFADGHFASAAFPSLVLGEQYPLSRSEAVKSLPKTGATPKPGVSGLGHFVAALAAVTA